MFYKFSNVTFIFYFSEYNISDEVSGNEEESKEEEDENSGNSEEEEVLNDVECGIPSTIIRNIRNLPGTSSGNIGDQANISESVSNNISTTDYFGKC